MSIQILILALILASFVIGFLILKTIVRAIFLALTILMIVLVVASVFVILDAAELKKMLPTAKKTVLLDDEGRIVAGFHVTSEPQLIGKEALDDLSRAFSEKRYDDMLGESYKLIVINSEVISELKEKEIALYDDESFSTAFLRRLINADKPIELLAQETGQSPEQLYVVLGDDTNLKNMVFARLFVEHIMPDAPFFLSQLRKGGISIYPETPIFKAIRVVPLQLIKTTALKRVKASALEEGDGDSR
ncbi:hypothetical protein COT48_01385 [Candidatus Woesearchaeota archaeon CG08_land_8_20_14_0_20_47_9]|nr:MAG: hypothetical protein AUJ69_00675 [Candidatus Woesearchaeota archaeon CG1_02_47_18]PIN72927.1 MAG: hypothetical protein COV22_01925 [Candidatus Woesearchaeota archaeon CG10_big_fil_rev_8_21_14_0_10_47_5]PIO04247.1 MAG: hypothetical protein COT48_01385 [Candidatus Woesearchaeota archaeon CG08_land_8_20_14_0_20_47_9]